MFFQDCFPKAKQDVTTVTHSLHKSLSYGLWVRKWEEGREQELQRVQILSDYMQEQRVRILCSFYFFKVLLVKNLS